MHFLELFDVQEQVQAFFQVLPDLIKRAEEWKTILHSRIMNSEIARPTFEEKIASRRPDQQSKINQLLSLASRNFSEELYQVLSLEASAL